MELIGFDRLNTHKIRKVLYRVQEFDHVEGVSNKWYTTKKEAIKRYKELTIRPVFDVSVKAYEYLDCGMYRFKETLHFYDTIYGRDTFRGLTNKPNLNRVIW